MASTTARQPTLLTLRNINTHASLESPEHPFPFLKLPEELQELILEYVLLDVPDHDPAKLIRSPPETWHQWNIARINTNVLLTSKKVSAVGIGVIIRRARLVHIRMEDCWSNPPDQMPYMWRVLQALKLTQIPILQRRFHRFAVMQHIISRRPGPSPNRTQHFEFLICGGDLEVLLCALMGDSLIQVFRCLPKWTCHHLIFQNPVKEALGGSRSDYMMARQHQEWILQPYRNHFRGFAQARISFVDGSPIEQDLAMPVLNSMVAWTMFSYDQVERKLSRLMQDGDELCEEGNFGCAFWRFKKCLNVWRLVTTAQAFWRPLVGDEEAGNLANIGHKILARLLCTLTHAWTLDPAVAAVGVVMKLFFCYSMSAIIALRVGLPGWQPPDETEASLHYWFAVAIRQLAYEDAAPAGRLALERALEVSPDDHAIHHERELYDGWQAAQRDAQFGDVLTYCRLNSLEGYNAKYYQFMNP